RGSGSSTRCIRSASRRSGRSRRRPRAAPVADTARRGVKRVIDGCCLALVSPVAALCLIEARLTDGSEAVFAFWAQTFALVPGVIGVFVRRAFYRLTLEAC